MPEVSDVVLSESIILDGRGVKPSSTGSMENKLQQAILTIMAILRSFSHKIILRFFSELVSLDA